MFACLYTYCIWVWFQIEFQFYEGGIHTLSHAAAYNNFILVYVLRVTRIASCINAKVSLFYQIGSYILTSRRKYAFYFFRDLKKSKLSNAISVFTL